MFIPRYSLRFLLGLLTACSVLFFVISRGLRGNAVAAGAGAAVLTVAIILLVHAVGFVCLAGLARFTRRWRPTGRDVADAVLLAALLGQTDGTALVRAQQFTLPGGSPNRANTVSVVGHGLTISVDAKWPGGHYRPLLVQISTVKTNPPVDRRITLAATMDSYALQRKRQRVEQTVTVPGDGSTLQVWFTVPNIPPANAARMEFIERGRTLPSLMAWLNVPYVNNGYFGGAGAPSIVAIDDAYPDSSSLRKALPHDEDQQWDTSTNPPRPIAMAPQALSTLLHVPPTVPLPVRWLDYSGLDVVSLPLAKAKQLSQKQPQAWQAIRRWCAAGGNVWLHGGGENWESLAEVDELLGPAIGLAPPDGATAPSATAGWFEPLPIDYVPRIRDASFDATYNYIEQRKQQQAGQWAAAATQVQAKSLAAPPADAAAAAVATPEAESARSLLAVEDEEAARPKPQPPARMHFVWRPQGFGSVVVLRAENAFPGTSVEWGAVLNTLTPARWNWDRRHGLQVHAENPDFWRLLIRDVGFARVWTFQALITGFVIVVGPLNYWWCRRRRQLHLLLLTVPCLALLATGGLVGYALAADGLGTKFRARSVTILNERDREAVCWSWQSYYSGMSPAAGLVFSEQTFVAPVGPVTGSTLGGGDRARRLVWDGQQRLRYGWLSARTPEQLLAVRSRETTASLKLLSAETPGQPPRVRNELGAAIEQLFAVDLSGQGYRADDIAAGATATLSAHSDPPHNALASIAQNHAIPFPPEMQAAGMIGAGAQSLRMFSNAQPSQLGIGSSVTLGEQTLAAGTEQNRWLAPGRYVAVVRRSPEVETGLPQVTETDSFHVVLGQW